MTISHTHTEAQRQTHAYSKTMTIFAWPKTNDVAQAWPVCFNCEI